jgi:hypothetical protein
MSLTSIQHQQGTIGGYFNSSHGNGPFRGTITPDRHLQFAVTNNAGQAILTFDGVVQSTGELTGTYCDLNQVGQCSDYGIWSASPEA